MPGETSFRVAEAQVPADTAGASLPVSEAVYPADEMPPSLYVEAHKVPLVLDIIGGTDAYRHFDMESLTRELDRYITDASLRNGLGDTHEGYRKAVSAALEKLSLPEGTDVYAKVEKLVRYFRIQHKLYSALRDREELMSADPAQLSAAKLGLYIKKGYAFK